MESMSLRVSIYSIPDLAGDELKGLKKYIVDEFKTYLGYDVDIQVESSADPYDLDTMRSTYLGPSDNSIRKVAHCSVGTPYSSSL